jgi:hypothetical protein
MLLGWGPRRSDAAAALTTGHAQWQDATDCSRNRGGRRVARPTVPHLPRQGLGRVAFLMMCSQATPFTPAMPSHAQKIET